MQDFQRKPISKTTTASALGKSLQKPALDPDVLTKQLQLAQLADHPNIGVPSTSFSSSSETSGFRLRRTSQRTSEINSASSSYNGWSVGPFQVKRKPSLVTSPVYSLGSIPQPSPATEFLYGTKSPSEMGKCYITKF